MYPSDLKLPQGAVSIVSKDPNKLEEIHNWIHDQSYDPSDVRYDAIKRILEVPFLCTVYELTRQNRGIPLLYRFWWVPVVRGYLRFHNVREHAVESEGFGMISEISVTPAKQGFSVTGISEISGVADEFEVELELQDAIIGWVRMSSVLLIESEGNMQGYNQSADDFKKNSV